MKKNMIIRAIITRCFVLVLTACLAYLPALGEEKL